ncbi:RNA-directed DNA polymerase, eukaryota [Tanacetum coccineum]
METNKISLLRKKFQALKAIIKKWSRDEMLKASAVRHSAQISLLKDIHDLDKRHSSDLAQKAKIQWAIEGQTINLDSHMFQKISIDQNADLESDVSLEEIKKAVWECGTNKSSGPDGFSFEFIQKYWNIIQHDVINVVKEFFSSSKFPLGSNSSFITLIPKSLDAKMVKDFRPISLIGSFYKIVAKILSNRLCIVMPDLISDYHKIKAMIFKADFEKAFDSVRWDYLDGVLNNFGFGVKWRGWIQACLSSAMGSILVNGSPSSEFKFHKGLKQGDPLSPFLFILVMESLHISFNNILNFELYKGGRFTLNKAVLSSLPIYLMSIYKTPVGVLRKLPRGSLEEEQFYKLIKDVNSVIFSVSNDRWIWSLDSSGEFSIKSTRLFIDDHLLLAVGAPTRWVSEVPIKINIMACRKGSHAHIFFSFSMGAEHYYQLACWWEFDCPDLFSYDDWLEWFHTLRLLKGFKDILEGFFMLCGG